MKRAAAFRLALLVQAVAGHRGQATINAPETTILPERREEVLHLPFVPFSEVCAACAAVIHHGGIGTIAQCLWAGVPSLVVPGGMDQPFNAAQVVQRRAGVWIPCKQYTTRRAEHALKALLCRPTYQGRVREIRAQILKTGSLHVVARLSRSCVLSQLDVRGVL